MCETYDDACSMASVVQQHSVKNAELSLFEILNQPLMPIS